MNEPRKPSIHLNPIKSERDGAQEPATSQLSANQDVARRIAEGQADLDDLQQLADQQKAARKQQAEMPVP
ncbi:MAG TPA: hypothetical protein DCS30_02985, partial [Rhizobiales bacterium]|nr:hypothetical protein [Hyphomicrobiales bacterium]